MLRLLTAAILAGLIGLAACDTGPTAPTSLTAPVSTHAESGPAETSAGTSDDGQLQSLTDRLVELQSADRSAKTQQELDRIRALIAALTGQLSPGGGGDGGGGDGGDVAPSMLTITDAGVNPTEIRLSTGQRVQIVNNSSQAREIQSDEHLFHTDCPPLNLPGMLAPGASGMTGVFDRAGTCRFHDHQNPTVSAFQGQVVIDGEGTGGGGGGGDGGTPYARGR